MKRYFNEGEAEAIREYLGKLNKGIDSLSDSEVLALQAIVGTHGRSVQEFRLLLGVERRKSRALIGDAPYLNFRVKKHVLSGSTQCKLAFETDGSTENLFQVQQNSEVLISELQIDACYQRTNYVNRKLVKSIQQDFNPLLAGVITVAVRSDGSKWVVDGFHRFLGAKGAGLESLACVFFLSRGTEHEAEVFHDLNSKRTGVNCISMYKAMLAQREEATVSIQQLLDKYGFDIGKNKRQFGAANTIRDAYQRGVLDRVLFVISQSFGDGDDARWQQMFGSSHFVQMLTILYSRYGEIIDDSRMCLVLARMHEEKYQQLAGRHAGTTGSRAAKLAPHFIEDVYNHQLRKGRIEWRYV